jgi:hypothetical protein
MKVRNFTLGLALAGITLAAAPAFAQSPREGGSPGGSSDRGGGGGTAGGNSGGGGGGGGVATGGGGGGSSSGGGSSMGGASFGSTSGSTYSNVSVGDRSFRQTAPSRRTEYAAFSSNGGDQARPRTGSSSGASGSGSSSSPDRSSGGSGDRAVPRSGSSGGGSDAASGGSVNTRERARPAADNGNSNNSAGAREVPTWSRPRGDRPVTGVAVDRVGPAPDPDRDRRGRYYGAGGYYGYGGYGGYYNGYYNGFYGCGYGWGCYPYSFGLGYGLYSGIGWNPYVGDPLDPYYSGGYGGYSSGVYNTRESGNLKLKVKPRTAKVYVDGFYVGLVDEFDGAFQKLALNSGRHKVEIRADGFETAEFDVVITPEQTVTFQGDLKRIQ